MEPAWKHGLVEVERAYNCRTDAACAFLLSHALHGRFVRVRVAATAELLRLAGSEWTASIGNIADRRVRDFAGDDLEVIVASTTVCVWLDLSLTACDGGGLNAASSRSDGENNARKMHDVGVSCNLIV